jgi:hypothetical protein
MPESFYYSFYACPGEMCTISPTPKYPLTLVHLEGIENPERINPSDDILRDWFVRASIPVVGEQAGPALDKALKTEEGIAFLKAAWESLKEKGQKVYEERRRKQE